MEHRCGGETLGVLAVTSKAEAVAASSATKAVRESLHEAASLALLQQASDSKHVLHGCRYTAIVKGLACDLFGIEVRKVPVRQEMVGITRKMTAISGSA